MCLGVNDKLYKNELFFSIPSRAIRISEAYPEHSQIYLLGLFLMKEFIIDVLLGSK